jgi:tetratricopeptide (TPR) repeat protein
MRPRVTKAVPATAAFVICLVLAGCSEQINYLKARNELNKGVKAFSAADYPTAAQHFEAAIELDGQLLDARSYRAYSYMMQFIPGGESAENLKVAGVALEGFEEVLKYDANNNLALSSIASLHFNMKEFDKAKQAYNDLLAKYPDNKEAHYTIGVINWTQCYQPRLEVRASLGMKQEDPGPIKDKKAREELAQKIMPLIEDGLDHLLKAIEIDPNYDDAMAYTNLLYRERADLSETKEEHDKYWSMADEWVQKTLDTKKKKAEEGTREQFSAE